MKRSFTFVVLLLASALLVGRGVFGAEIRARISPAPPIASQPFQLTLETAGTPDGEPDFSVLARDFEILHRSISQHTQNRNGQISRQIRWRLTLLQRTGKASEIPPIPFGNEFSNPVPISHQLTAEPLKPSPRTGSPVTPAQTRASSPLQTPKAVTAPAPEVPSQLITATPVPARNDSNRSPWTLLLAIVPGTVLLLIWWQQRRRRQQSREIPATEQKVEMPVLEGEALRQACRTNDAEAAARALMQWATQRWPDSPPSNIGPLARRFAGTDVEMEIRKLAQVLYSPAEKSWQGSLLWQVMKDLVVHPVH